MQLSKEIIRSLMPEGALWSAEDDAGLDLLLDGVADNHEAVKDYLAGIARLRDPLNTPILADLETEYGVEPDDSIANSLRRERLLATKTAGNSDGTLEFMQEKLNAAGFPLTVYANDPVIDPGLVVSFSPNSITGNEDALFGKDGAIFGTKNGYLLVNGPIYYNQAEVEYTIPPSNYWPMVFFIGGEATQNVLTGAIELIEPVNIPVSRKNELIRLIIKYKPMHSWCGLVVRYINEDLSDPEDMFAGISKLFASESWTFGG